MAKNAFARMIQPIRDMIINMVLKGTVLAIDDTGEIQLVSVKVNGDEEYTEIERLQPYGLSTNPKKGAEVLLMSPGGNLDNALAMMIENGKNRIKGLEEGEVVLYSIFSQNILLNKNGEVVISDKTLLGTGASENLIRGLKFETYFNSFINVFKTWVPPVGTPDSGAALKTLFTAWEAEINSLQTGSSPGDATNYLTKEHKVD